MILLSVTLKIKLRDILRKSLCTYLNKKKDLKDMANTTFPGNIFHRLMCFVSLMDAPY